MIERCRALAELPIVHGFTTRRGGVSQGRYASLNMGGKWGDEPEAVAENVRRVAAAAGFDPEQIRRARQVHGAEVVRARDLDEETQADAVWCHRDDDPVVVAVLTADCVPVLLADREGRVACAVHSGWRGTVAGVVPAAVRALQSAGVEPQSLVAAIGPCIELASFEVGPEVAEQFESPFVDRDSDPKPHVDLVGCVRAQLRAAGLAAEAIERVGGCTFADADRYFSYRRDGKGIGQMLSFVGFRR
jgi:YfiH family protein